MGLGVYHPRKFSKVTSEAAIGVDDLQIFRSHLHLEDTIENNTLIAAYRDSARQIIERELGVVMLNETWEFATDAAPLGETIYLPKAPLVSVTSVTSYDDADSGTTYASSNYVVDTSGNRIFLAQSSVWPTDLREFRSIVVSYVAGYGTALTTLPPLLLQGLLVFVGHLWENREDASMPRSVRQLVAPFMQFES
tara:strand:+ start:140 stop:721 length:582 start_codon:yes stop_codon:yes gene_type:complete